jgi:hypothetical protein
MPAQWEKFCVPKASAMEKWVNVSCFQYGSYFLVLVAKGS